LFINIFEKNKHDLNGKYNGKLAWANQAPKTNFDKFWMMKTPVFKKKPNREKLISHPGTNPTINRVQLHIELIELYFVLKCSDNTILFGNVSWFFTHCKEKIN
jgi:hypothetical protein